MTEIDWAHRESLRMWRVLAARGHEGAQAVASFHNLPPLPASALAPGAPVPAPPPVTASVPQAPRAVAPAVPQTPALAGISRRTEVLTSLLGRPAPVAPTDKHLV
jgi:hypothetical protein